MLVPYPREFPAYALSLMADKLRGKPVDLSTAIHAAWVVAGYALENIVPDSPQVIGSVEGDEAEAEFIDNLVKDMQSQTAIKGFIPYALLAEIAARLLLKLLTGDKKNA